MEWLTPGVLSFLGNVVSGIVGALGAYFLMRGGIVNAKTVAQGTLDEKRLTLEAEQRAGLLSATATERGDLWTHAMGEIKRLQESVDDMRKTLEVMRSKESAWQDQLNNADRRYSDLLSRVSNYETSKVESDKLVQLLQAEVNGQKAEIAGLRQELKDANAKIEQLTADLAKANAEITRLTGLLQASTEKIKDAGGNPPASEADAVPRTKGE